MGRFPQSEATKGSQKWIQKIINEKPNFLNSKVRATLDIPEREKIEWLSPLKKDDYAEYRDDAVFNLLQIYVHPSLRSAFWPERGPQWDAIGKTQEKIFLLEAKAHIPELLSSLKAKNLASVKTITASLESTKKELGSKADFDWSKTFYQYANRLANVNFLRHLDMSAYLINVYFVNDSEMNGPKSVDEWNGALSLLHKCLGLNEHSLERYVINVFIDVNKL